MERKIVQNTPNSSPLSKRDLSVLGVEEFPGLLLPPLLRCRSRNLLLFAAAVVRLCLKTKLDTDSPIMISLLPGNGMLRRAELISGQIGHSGGGEIYDFFEPEWWKSLPRKCVRRRGCRKQPRSNLCSRRLSNRSHGGGAAVFVSALLVWRKKEEEEEDAPVC